MNQSLPFRAKTDGMYSRFFSKKESTQPRVQEPARNLLSLYCDEPKQSREVKPTYLE